MDAGCNTAVVVAAAGCVRSEPSCVPSDVVVAAADATAAPAAAAAAAAAAAGPRVSVSFRSGLRIMRVSWRPAYAASCEWQLAYSLQVDVLFGVYTTLASASTA